MTSDALRGIRGFLIDLNGVVYQDDVAIPGAAETIEAIRFAGLPFLFCSNTTTSSLDTLHSKLVSLGLPINKSELFGVTRAAVALLRKQGTPSLHFILDEDTQKDFAEFPVSSTKPDFIVIGEVGDRFSYNTLNRAFRLVLKGAVPLALHKGRYWQVDGELRLSVGSFVSCLEYATSAEAIVIGKPTEKFYKLALAELKLEADQVAMIGDDILTDVGGAQCVGMKGIQVKTGKYRPGLVANSGVTPDLLIDSIADLRTYLTSSNR